LKEVCTQCGKSYAEGTKFCPADGTELMATMLDPLIGMVLPRRYRIMSLLGRGSMSVVYKGTYEPLDQLVAVKMLKSHLVSDHHQAKRFQQEIKTAGSLSHPNIVGILDFGVTDQGVPYLIMEYLDGKSLSDILEEQERVSVNRVIRMFAQAADALAYAHREGVIHRDIKPSNIIVVDTEDETDVIKIVDFGIAKIQTAAKKDNSQKFPDTQGLTQTGEVLGTPLYMSPEQSQGKDLDGRSDIYSLGCVMYHALTGKPPFVGDTAIDTMRLQITATATPIEIVRPDLYFPERLQSILTKALAKDPRMRYQRMEHFQSDLESCIRRDANPLASSVRGVSVAQPIPTIQPEPRRFETSLGLPALCAIVGVLIIAGVGLWAVTTDVGKKDAQFKVPLPVATEGAWKELQTKGENELNEGRYEDAEKSLQEALIEARKFKQPDERLARTMNAIARAYYQQDRLADSEKLTTDALRLARSISSSSALTADTLANLSRIQCANGKYREAEASAREAMSLRENKLGPAHQDVASSLQALAEIECKRGNIDKAAALLTKALTIAEKSLGEDNPDVASIVHDLGMVRERQKNYPAAKELFNRALGIRQRFLGTEHPLVSDTMCALGTLNFNTNQGETAEALFNSALEIRLKSYGPNSSKSAEIYSCLAILYDSERKYQKAEECYRKAVEIREAVWGSDSPRLVRSLDYLARFLREHGQNKGAEFYEGKIRQIRSASKT
jgi:serine/threonine protein kinase/tetratricopeptide (TPR) repeat protein